MSANRGARRKGEGGKSSREGSMRNRVFTKSSLSSALRTLYIRTYILYINI